jgi:hypothetical protein
MSFGKSVGGYYDKRDMWLGRMHWLLCLPVTKHLRPYLVEVYLQSKEYATVD